MTESEAQAPKRLALFSAAGKGVLIGIALTLIWPAIRLITRQDAPSFMIFLLNFVVLGVTGATAAAFYFSSNGVTRRPAVFSGILAGLFVGLIAGFLNALVSPNVGGTPLDYVFRVIPLALLGPFAGGLGAWGTSLLPSTMFFQAETPTLATRLGEEKIEEVVEQAPVRDTSLNTVQKEKPADSPVTSEADAPGDPIDDLRSEIQSDQGFASDNIISTPWDDDKGDVEEEIFKAPWELDTPEETVEQDVQEDVIEEQATLDEAYTPAWATSLPTSPDKEEISSEAPADEPSLDSRLSDLAASEDFSSFQEETAEEPTIAEEVFAEPEPQTKLQEAVALYEGGQKEAAQRMLAQIVRNDEPENALAWLWLAATLENDFTKKRFCVQRAITIDPGNQAALKLAADIEATILPPKP